MLNIPHELRISLFIVACDCFVCYRTPPKRIDQFSLILWWIKNFKLASGHPTENLKHVFKFLLLRHSLAECNLFFLYMYLVGPSPFLYGQTTFVKTASFFYKNMTSPCLGKHINPLVPTSFRYSTVVTDNQKPKNLAPVFAAYLITPLLGCEGQKDIRSMINTDTQLQPDSQWKPAQKSLGKF